MPAQPDVELRWHRTTLDGRVAVYGEAGEGPPVVFVHGWGLTAKAYAAALPGLARAGARVIAPALPGFGESDPLPGEYTWEKMARWMHLLLEHVGIDEPLSLVGHSFGGGVATVTAHHAPEKVRALVLVNSVGGSVWKNGKAGERSMADRPLWDWGLHFQKEWTQKTYRKVLPVVARDFVTNALSNFSALRRAGNLARSADLREELSELAAKGIPVTVLWGKQDQVVPEAAFLAMCDAAGAPGDILETAGHSWLIADPEGFGEMITNSLSVKELIAHEQATQALEAGGAA